MEAHPAGNHFSSLLLFRSPDYATINQTAGTAQCLITQAVRRTVKTGRIQFKLLTTLPMIISSFLLEFKAF